MSVLLSNEAKLVAKNVTDALSDVNENLDAGGAIGAIAQGKIFEITKHNEWAVKSYELAYNMDANNLEALARLVVANIHVGKFDDALERAVQLAAFDKTFTIRSLCQGEDYTACTLLAEALLLNDRIEEARNAYQMALDLNSGDIVSAGRLAQISLAKGEIQQAVDGAKLTQNSPRFKQLRAMATLAENQNTILPVLQLDTIKRLAGTASSAVGRPLTVEGSRVRASVTGATGWLADSPARFLGDIDEGVVEHWEAVAKEEHSSIASFARFLLEIMHFGAPADLVSKTIAAMEDETRHAREAFSVSSRLRGAEVGAGSLDMRKVLVRPPELRRAVREAVFEGCVSETIGALAAGEGAKLAKQTEISDTLTTITVDEMRHADLAWEFIEWALSQDTTLANELLPLLESSPEELANASMSEWQNQDTQGGNDYGVLHREQMEIVTRLAFEKYIAPRAKHLYNTCLASTRQSIPSNDSKGNIHGLRLIPISETPSLLH